MMGMVEAPQISDLVTRTNRRPCVRVIRELWYCKDLIEVFPGKSHHSRNKTNLQFCGPIRKS